MAKWKIVNISPKGNYKKEPHSLNKEGGYISLAVNAIKALKRRSLEVFFLLFKPGHNLRPATGRQKNPSLASFLISLPPVFFYHEECPALMAGAWSGKHFRCETVSQSGKAMPFSCPCDTIYHPPIQTEVGIADTQHAVKEVKEGKVAKSFHRTPQKLRVS